jgi:hypothetical protein
VCQALRCCGSRYLEGLNHGEISESIIFLRFQEKPLYLEQPHAKAVGNHVTCPTVSCTNIGCSSRHEDEFNSGATALRKPLRNSLPYKIGVDLLVTAPPNTWEDY